MISYFNLKTIPTEDPVAATVLGGIRLRALREYYFGKRTAHGSKPIKLKCLGKFKTWGGMLRTLSGIGIPCAENWIRLADAFERLAESEGISLSATLEKPPWDWSPEESALVNDTAHKLCGGKTQQELRQAAKTLI